MMAVKPVARRLVTAFWNPILSKEIHSRMRSARAMILLVAFLAILSTIAYTSYRNLSPDTARVAALTSAGSSVFNPLAGTCLALLTLFVPGLVGGAVAGERERQTLDLLLVTPMRPLRIVLGKLFASLLFIIFLIVAALPIFSIVFVLGGVPLSLIAEAFAVLLATVVMLGALGMMASVLSKRASQATLVAFVLTALVYLLPLLYMSAAHQNYSYGYSYYGGYNGPGWVANLSPYSAMTDVTSGGNNAIAYASYNSGLYANGLSLAPILQSPPPPPVPAWAEHVIDATIVSVAAIAVSVLSLRGRAGLRRARPGDVPQVWPLTSTTEIAVPAGPAVTQLTALDIPSTHPPEPPP